MGGLTCLVSFEESSALLRELAGVEVSVSQVQRGAEALGKEIADDERACVERMGEAAPTMYLGMDGTGVPMRPPEVAGRPGKQPDGSPKTREAKVVTVWTAESRDTQPATIRSRRAGAAGSHAPRLRRGTQMRSPGRSLRLDLEHRRRTLSSGDSDSGSVPCQRGFAPNRSIHLWHHQPRG